MTGNITQRETAWRVFANELNSASMKIEPTEEKMPVYQMSPLGAKLHRVLIAGTLIEKINGGTEEEPKWRARIQDVNGQFFINVGGMYQPEALAAMADLEPPCFVAAIGRVNSYTGQDGRVLVSVRPERIVQIEESTLNGWILDTAKSAWTRLKWMKEVVSLPDAKVPDLIKMGMTSLQAESMLYALDNYGQMPDSAEYLKTIQAALRRLIPGKNVDFGFADGVDGVDIDELDLSNNTVASENSEKYGAMKDAVVRLLQELDDVKGVQRDELERRAAEEGIGPMELEEITDILMDEGVIFEPDLKTLRLV